MRKIKHICFAALLVLSLVSLVSAVEFSGTTRLGWTLLDETGSAAVNQPTFNLYEGASVSLEKFALVFDDGTRIYGDLKNITLNNRNLKVGLRRSNNFGLTIRHKQYRHNYSADGNDFTRRRNWNGQLWIQPTTAFRIYGGYGQTAKHGLTHNLFEPVGSSATRTVDYDQTFSNAGLRFAKDRHTATFDYQHSKFSDKTNTLSDRVTSRFRLTGAMPMPRTEHMLINAGYQHYEVEVDSERDTLKTNAFWAGTRIFMDDYTIKYSFLFDRSRRTGDPVGTDNILHGLYLSRKYKQLAGWTIGYRYRSTDDLYDEKAVNGYFLSGWWKATPEFTFKAGYGNEQTTINSGFSIMGEKSYTRAWGAIKYRRENTGFDLKIKNRSTENDGFTFDRSTVFLTPFVDTISFASSTDYIEIATDLFWEAKNLGVFAVGYSFSDGDYTNDEGTFAYREQVLSGDFAFAKIGDFNLELGATYVKGTQDVDYEWSRLSSLVAWEFRAKHHLEVKYMVHNFDNYNDPTRPYSEYYTANIVEINLVKEL